jgi:nitrogenase molybdenum-iron protein alpha/beta subunit
MTGFDFDAIAQVIEDRTGIPAFGFATTGMDSYVSGAGMALAAIAERFVEKREKTGEKSVNILGLTPLDFSVNGTDRAICGFLEDRGWKVQSRWAMGADLEELKTAAGAHINLVVSETGLAAAKVLERKFGIPYVAGVPVGAFAERIAEALESGGQCLDPALPGAEIVILGEAVTSVSLARAIEEETGRGVRVLCATSDTGALLRDQDRPVLWEEDLERELRSAKTVIADPMFRPIVPVDAKFVHLPAEWCSGRIYREEIPNLIKNFETFRNEVL